MAIVVNNPQPVQQSDNGFGFLMGAVVLVVFAILFFVYALPYIRSNFQVPQITIPSQVDVNVKQK